VRFSLEQPLAARSFGPASNQPFKSLRSTAAASRGVACRSESFSAFSAARIPCGAGHDPVSFIDSACSAVIARAAGGVVNWPGCLSVNRLSFGGSSVVGPHVLVDVQLCNSSASRFGAERNTVSFTDSTCSAITARAARQRGLLARPFNHLHFRSHALDLVLLVSCSSCSCVLSFSALR
jgi:hypothetical protein